MTTTPVWKAERLAKNVVAIEWPVRSRTTFAADLLPVFDAHQDNPHCDRKLLTKHLDQARERGAAVVIPGDFFCAMQGKYDPRSDKSTVRPEHQCGDYLDALVRTAADLLEPYAQNIAWIAPGNHETAIKKRHETDLIERLVATLNDRTGAGVVSMGYTGWTLMCFKRGNQNVRQTVWHTHGYGGGGKTQGFGALTVDTSMYIDADVRMCGHTHHRFSSTMMRHRINHNRSLEEQPIHTLKCSSYKDAYGDGSGGFEVERGHGPRPKGGYWIRWAWQDSSVVRTVEETV